MLQLKLTCSRGAGSMVRLLWQVEDLLTWIRWGNGVLTLPSCNRVVLFTIIICIEEFLKPLDEIEIVLESALNQFLHRNDLRRKKKEWVNHKSQQANICSDPRKILETHLVHIHSFEGCLQQFKIVDIFMLQFSLKLDLFKTNAAREEQIHELAISSSYRNNKGYRESKCVNCMQFSPVVY